MSYFQEFDCEAMIEKARHMVWSFPEKRFEIRHECARILRHNLKRYEVYDNPCSVPMFITNKLTDALRKYADYKDAGDDPFIMDNFPAHDVMELFVGDEHLNTVHRGICMVIPKELRFSY